MSEERIDRERLRKIMSEPLDTEKVLAMHGQLEALSKFGTRESLNSCIAEAEGMLPTLNSYAADYLARLIEKYR